MTLTIEVSAELERRLEAEARNYGVGRDEFVRVVLEEKLNQKPKNCSTDYGKIIATGLPVRDRSKEKEWLRINRDEYDGQCVALDGNRLLAHGSSLKEVAKHALDLGVPDPYIVRVEGNRTLPHVGGV